MKVISIGRGTDCQVVFDDPTISRRHAILKIYTFGKMELVDMGQNGTFVNGVKLSPNVPYPVSRKDVVSFAHVRQLDWNMIPDPMRFVKYGMLAIVGMVIIIALAVWVKSLNSSSGYMQEIIPAVTQPVDSISGTQTPANEENEEAEVKEEIKYPKLKVPGPKKEKVKKEEPKQEQIKPEEEEKPKENKPIYL